MPPRSNLKSFGYIEQRLLSFFRDAFYFVVSHDNTAIINSHERLVQITAHGFYQPEQGYSRDNMSVYTHLSQQDIEQFLTLYDIGQLEHFTGIEGGVENTNYFLDVVKEGTRARYVLTLFEYLPAETLPFFIAYTDELKADGLPVPNPVRDIRGRALHTLKNKPALIVQCFRGKHPDPTALTTDHCAQVGTMLARIHAVSEKNHLHQKNQRGLPWLNEQQKRLQPLLSPEDAKYMKEQWQDISQSLRPFTSLPEGLIHGDLFHDNVLLDQGKISAVIDFYQACHDWLIYDLAVTVNDWCITDGLQLDPARFNALANAYRQVRPFTEEEKAAWPLILRLGAFRFWISRIITFVHPEQPTDDEHHDSLERQESPERQESLVRAFLDPDEFRDMLKLRTESTVPALP